MREFRALQLNEFTDLFVQVVRLSREIFLITVGIIAFDAFDAFG